ncbi:hypothetical protein PVAND_004075 [Polypedilum vanderplanki]|uniref:Phosphodiesterase n=1 Tax=Polypedilum vanderplanki TaxID=319348 RepID=A0A9J6BVY4_POLVA|nr:hypothetical protein PVAND_004075 [Polypedilum vanderplanki]
MFHAEAEAVDVELLAECGQIAQRLRSLEQTWLFDLKELQRSCLCNFGTPPALASSKKLSDIYDVNDNTPGSELSPELIEHVRNLEDIAIGIYYQRELQRQALLQEGNANARRAPLGSTMNYSVTSGSSSNNHDLTSPTPSTTAQNDTNVSSSRDNNKNDDCDKDQKAGLANGNSQQYIHQQQQLCNKITNDDLQLLLRELRRKVDYTEKMNWLCLSNRPNPPPHRKSSLPKHSDVKLKFLEICHTTLSDDVKAALRLPSFDSYDWEDYEILHLMETMFIELNFIEKFHISPIRLREWLYEVYKHYNDVPFHNFRHCFCVAQMMYAITWQTNLICRLGDLDVFILLISCICHDLDHPGYNNIYQINARTELALRYNDISCLENHHCSIAFRLLEYPECNLLEDVTKDMYKEIREGIIRCILATDMARHNEILTQFREIIPVFDYSNVSHKNLLCMVLIKVADISNEARPMDIAEPWLDRLLQEFFAQSAAEKLEGLPVTPFMDPDKVSKPGSQVRFIGLVLLPLFEALGELLPELIDFIIIPVRVALDFYKRLNDASQKNRKSLVEEGSSDGNDEIIPRSQSGISVRSRRSIPSQKSASRNSVDEEQLVITAELQDLPEGSESGDSETATEVDVAEKASKFKVDTESRTKFNMIHRKGHHRDKRPSMVSEMGGRMRGSYGNILQNNYNSRTNTFGSNRAISLDHYSNHRRMSDGIQTVTSDSTVYYHQRLHDQDSLLRAAAATVGKKKSSSCQGSTDIKLLVNDGEDTSTVASMKTTNMNAKFHIMTMAATADHSDTNRVQSPTINNNNNNNNNNSNNNNASNSSSLTSKSVKSKLNSSVSCSSNSPKSIITRLRQLTGRLSFSFDKDSRRMSGGGGGVATQTQTIIKTSPSSINSSSKNNNILLPNTCVCSNTKSAPIDVTTTSRNRAYSLDVPPTRYNYNSSAGSSNNGSHRSLSSNRANDDVDDSTTDTNSVFASKKMSSEVESMDI